MYRACNEIFTGVDLDPGAVGLPEISGDLADNVAALDENIVHADFQHARGIQRLRQLGVFVGVEAG